MKLDINLFGKLEKIRKSINAQKPNLGVFRENRQSYSKNPFEVELLEKGDIELSAIQIEKEISYPAGLIALGNTQATLYIGNPSYKLEKFLMETKEEPNVTHPKVHVCDCQTLDQMRKNNRFNRYGVNQRNINGYKIQPTEIFSNKLITKSINPKDYTDGMKKALSYCDQEIEEGKMKVKLQICKNCLKFLNYKGYEDCPRDERKNIFENFNLNEFIENYKYIFRCLPLYNDNNFPDAEYTPDWAKVSEQFRRNANWICTSCQVDLSKKRGLLHVHHIDGNKGNNRPSNLEVLCAICHSKKPYHSNMFIKKEEKEIIQNFRNDQDL